MAVQQQVQPDGAGREAGDDRPGEALPGLLGADGGGHRMPPDQDAGEVAADVAADRDDDEQEHPPPAAGRGEHQRHGHGQQRHVGQREHGGAAGGERYQRQADPALEQGLSQFPEGQGDNGTQVDQERGLHREQGDQRDPAEHEADRDGHGQVAARPARLALAYRVGLTLSELPAWIVRHAGAAGCVASYTSRSSASLCLSRSSTWATYTCVRSSSSRSARRPSSSPASPPLTSLSIVSLACRRMLRIETRLSSALCRAILMNSLRRSSESSGKITRMMAPSFDGLTPRSLFLIAFSIAAMDDLSKG